MKICNTSYNMFGLSNCHSLAFVFYSYDSLFKVILRVMECRFLGSYKLLVTYIYKSKVEQETFPDHSLSILSLHRYFDTAEIGMHISIFSVVIWLFTCISV